MISAISNNSLIELNIKKSKFVCYSFYCTHEQQVLDIIKNLKVEHNNATHVCYAYVLNGQEKCNDDGEPSGTAGLPMLEVIKKNNLKNVLVVVVRYFGGVKLGVGGLVRAYSKGVSEVIKLSQIKKLQKYKIYNIYTDFKNIQLINKIINDNEIIVLNTTYNADIVIKIAFNKEKVLPNLLGVRIENLGEEWL